MKSLSRGHKGRYGKRRASWLLIGYKGGSRFEVSCSGDIGHTGAAYWGLATHRENTLVMQSSEDDVMGRRGG